jgi:hypothetical protein
MVSASILDDEVGLVLDRRQLDLLVELGGGESMGSGDRAAAVADLEACGVVRTDPDRIVRPVSPFDVLAEILARPVALLDLHIVTNDERRRSSYLLTSDGAARVVRAEDHVIITPLLSDQVLLQVTGELALDPDISPKSTALPREDVHIDDETLRAVIDGREPDLGSHVDPAVIDSFSNIRYSAIANTGAGELCWLVDGDGMAWMIRGGLSTDATSALLLRRVHPADLVLALGQLLVEAAPNIEQLVVGHPNRAGRSANSSETSLE